MSESKIRRALEAEFEKIYLMGFDAWADGTSELEYLEGCRSSPKYQRGTWYVLEDDSNLLSSLIVYKFSADQFGIGSIATPPQLRRKGLASELVAKVIAELEDESGAKTFFLYSDISPEFYEKFGFKRLPVEAQRYKTTTCMVRGVDIENFKNDASQTPEYF